MAFRQTAFNPTQSQQFRITNGPGNVGPGGQINMPTLEENLAREMARMKMENEKKQREIEKICAESPELRELQNKIKSAYLNKERATQVTENQYRKQVEVVSKFVFRKNCYRFSSYLARFLCKDALCINISLTVIIVVNCERLNLNWCIQEIDAEMEKEMLRQKELQDLIQRQKEEERKRLAL